jgi:hypothetical protein
MPDHPFLREKVPPNLQVEALSALIAHLVGCRPRNRWPSPCLELASSPGNAGLDGGSRLDELSQPEEAFPPLPADERAAAGRPRPAPARLWAVTGFTYWVQQTSSRQLEQPGLIGIAPA